MESEEVKLITNLKDAGCTDETIAAFLQYRQTNEQAKQKNLLKKHRSILLDRIHEDQKAIDCLDYLLYKLK
jgi:DNA-binding transcriptional MerR regulator